MIHSIIDIFVSVLHILSNNTSVVFDMTKDLFSGLINNCKMGDIRCAL